MIHLWHEILFYEQERVTCSTFKLTSAFLLFQMRANPPSVDKSCEWCFPTHITLSPKRIQYNPDTNPTDSTLETFPCPRLNCSATYRYLTGMVDKRTLEKYEREAKEKNRETWWATDTFDQNRSSACSWPFQPVACLCVPGICHGL